MTGLHDLRIIAVEQYGAGPFASLHLAELGADVIKVEDARIGGDIGRDVPPFRGERDSLFFQSFNRNKRSIALDLSTPAGREVLQQLATSADVLLHNLRGDVPNKLELRYADFAAVNPQLVVCSLTGFGTSGSRRSQPAYDYVVQGMAGWMELTGEPDGPPAKSGLSLVDYCGGLVAAMSILAGVHAARRDGVGGECDLSLFDAAVSMLSYPATWYLTAGHEVSRQERSGHPSIAPFGAFPTADGWLMLACVKPKFFDRLVHVLGRPELSSDPRFADLDSRRAHRHELTAILDSLLRRRTTEHWLELLEAARVPCGPVNTLAEALDDPLVRERDMIVGTPHPQWGTVRHVRTAGRGWWPAVEPQRAPELGEHRDEVLRELLGYDETAIDQLDDAGAFGPRRPATSA